MVLLSPSVRVHPGAFKMVKLVIRVCNAKFFADKRGGQIESFDSNVSSHDEISTKK